MKIQLPSSFQPALTTQQPKVKDIVFFDVETPNRHQNRICAIGVIRVSPTGEILASRYYLVNPECSFDGQCISVHGIMPDDVVDKPPFSFFWEMELLNLFDNADLVAHNATFDLNVLRKVLSNYNLSLPATRCLCTKKMAEKYMPTVPFGYGLDNLSAFIGTPLLHHHAMSDAQACMQLFYYMVNNCGMNPLSEWVPYDPADGLIGFTKKGQRQIGYKNQSEVVEAQLPAAVERNAFVDPRGQIFCLTGRFFNSPDTKDRVEEYLISKGAEKRVSFPTLECSLLVVGSLGSSQWKYNGYGRKIERAMELQKEGKSNIRIVDEPSVIKDDFK